MGQTVVFTVSLDADDVAVDELSPRAPRHLVRDATRTALRDRRWRLAALACLVVPAVAAGVTFGITGGPWVSTVFVGVAAFVTSVFAAWAGTRVALGERAERAAGWAVTGALGAALALASVPGVLLIGMAEPWSESQAIPTLVVLALVGAAGAWFGLAVGNARRPWAPVATGVVVAALTLAPFGVVAALVPQTVVTERVVYHSFLPTYAAGHPAYICRDEMVEVTRRHTELVAWIGLLSPLAWVVDAAAFSPKELADAAEGSVAQAQAWTRSTRVGPDEFIGHCYQPTSLGTPVAVEYARYAKAAPLGAKVATASALLCAALALVLVSRRRPA